MSIKHPGRGVAGGVGLFAPSAIVPGRTHAAVKKSVHWSEIKELVA